MLGLRNEDQDRMKSKKMDINSGKINKSKNLGSAHNYFDDSNTNKYQVKQEKIEVVKEED